MHERIFVLFIVIMGLLAGNNRAMAQETAPDSADVEKPVVLYSGTPKKLPTSRWKAPTTTKTMSSSDCRD